MIVTLDALDPARWPFCEQRARDAAALSAYPLEGRGRTRDIRTASRPTRDQVAEARQRRSLERAEAGTG